MAEQKSGVKAAFFVTADISGYTKVMAETPIEHAKGQGNRASKAFD